ncbi:MAG: hypothetical protein R2939_03265 [Kofleriaceae bacterium]
MTISLRTARALQRARSRLRDVAAAAHARRVATVERAALTRAELDARAEVTFDDAAATLAHATSVRAFDQAALQLDASAAELRAAEHELACATQAAEISAAAVRLRAQQVRATEALVERLDEARASSEQRLEQRTADDRAGRRRTPTP